MVRLLALLSVLFLGFASSAFAGGKEDPCSYPGYKDGACQPGDGDQDQDDGEDMPGHPGHGHPGHGHGSLCSGQFQGLYATGLAVAFELRRMGHNQVQVQAWYGGSTFIGTGICTPFSRNQASFEFYFAGSPVHRGVISRQPHAGIVMDGQLDYHYGFQLRRLR